MLSWLNLSNREALVSFPYWNATGISCLIATFMISGRLQLPVSFQSTITHETKFKEYCYKMLPLHLPILRPSKFLSLGCCSITNIIKIAINFWLLFYDVIIQANILNKLEREESGSRSLDSKNNYIWRSLSLHGCRSYV